MSTPPKVPRHLVACIHTTIDTDSRLRIATDGRSIDMEDVKLVISESDQHALEEALQIKDRYGGRVTVLLLAPPGEFNTIRDTARKCLALGADQAIRLEDPEARDRDCRSIAFALTEELRQLAPELVLAGNASDDTGSAGVGPMIATDMDLPCVTDVIELSLGEERNTATRIDRQQASLETVAFTLPAIITCDRQLNHPRYATLKGIMKAKRLPQEARPGAGKENQAQMISLKYATRTRRKKFIPGDGQEAAENLLETLRDDGLIATETVSQLPPVPTLAPEIVVFVEHAIESALGASLECLGAARGLGARVIAVMDGSITDSLIATVSSHGASEIILLESSGPYSSHVTAAAAADLVSERRAIACLAAATSSSSDLMPRLAAHLDSTVFTDCSGIEIVDEAFRLRRWVYGRKIEATVQSKAPVTCATLRPNSFPRGRSSPSAPMSRRRLDRPAKNTTVRFDTLIEENARDHYATVGLIGGSGLAGHEDFVLIQALSEKLGNARVAATPGGRDQTPQRHESLERLQCRIALGFGLDSYRTDQIVRYLKHFETTIIVGTQQATSYSAEADYFIQADPSEFLHSLLAAIRRDRQEIDSQTYEPYKLV